MVAREVAEPDSLFVFAVDAHREDRHFIFRRKLRQLVRHGFENLRTLQKPPGAVVAQIENQNEREWFARLTFAREIRKRAQIAVVIELQSSPA